MSDRNLPPDTAARVLIGIYRDAERNLTVRLAQLVESETLGTVPYITAQRAHVQRLLAELTDVALTGGQVSENAYRAALAATDTVLDVPAYRFVGVHQAAVQNLSLSLTGNLTNAIRTVGRSTEDVFRQAQLYHAAVGTAQGEERRKISQRMARDLRSRGITAFVDRRGHRWSLQGYAKMAVRTNMREAVTVAVESRLIELDPRSALVTFSSHNTTTPVCIPYEGNTYALNQAAADATGYPLLDDHAPLHPGCWHVETPAAASFEAFERALVG